MATTNKFKKALDRSGAKRFGIDAWLAFAISTMSVEEIRQAIAVEDRPAEKKALELELARRTR